MSSFTYTCGRCGGSIGPPPDGQRDHICADKRPPIEPPEEGVPFVDPIIEHAQQAEDAGKEGTP